MPAPAAEWDALPLSYIKAILPNPFIFIGGPYHLILWLSFPFSGSLGIFLNSLIPIGSLSAAP